MKSIIHWIDKAFTNKQDMQAFVLLMLILFIVFTKFYLVATGNMS